MWWRLSEDRKWRTEIFFMNTVSSKKWTLAHMMFSCPSISCPSNSGPAFSVNPFSIQAFTNSGVFRIWQRGAWRARGARAYNGGLGAEPPAGSRNFLLLNVQWKPQIRPFFWNLETQKTIKHCWIVQFLLENGKKRTFSYKVACKKFSWSGQRGRGPSHRGPPPKYATVHQHNTECSMYRSKSVNIQVNIACQLWINSNA